MAAVCCAAYGLKARVIEKRAAQIQTGHGDGVATRAMEILHSFGLARRVEAEAIMLRPPQHWNADGPGGMELWGREGGAWSWSNIASKFSTYALSQARLQDIMWEYVHQKGCVAVDRGLTTHSISVLPDEAYPVRLLVSTTGDMDAPHARTKCESILVETGQPRGENGERDETIKARYVLACDGAHSWVRSQLRIGTSGEETEVIWGVMDFYPLTDFPSARRFNYIVSKEQRSGLLWIPRERGLTRVYCVVGTCMTSDEASRICSSVTEKSIFAAIKTNMRQYNIDYKHCEWWTAYRVAQRIANDNIDSSGHVFLAGDAVHAHSPKAGQGVNVSIADSHNLVWKLNLVLKGQAEASILDTYRSERLPVARKLVSFDRSISAIASGREPPPVPVDSPDAMEMLSTSHNWATVFFRGLDVVMSTNPLMHSTVNDLAVAKSHFKQGRLPPEIVTGLRMPEFLVCSHADMNVVDVHDILQVNGCKFQLVIFAGDLTLAPSMSRLFRVAEALRRLEIPKDILECFTIHASRPSDFTNWITEFPDICRPPDPVAGYDYFKVFYDGDLSDGQPESAYERCCIDLNLGRLVLIRPDGFVAWQGGLTEESFKDLDGFFLGFISRLRRHYM